MSPYAAGTLRLAAGYPTDTGKAPMCLEKNRKVLCLVRVKRLLGQLKQQLPLWRQLRSCEGMPFQARRFEPEKGHAFP